MTKPELDALIAAYAQSVEQLTAQLGALTEDQRARVSILTSRFKKEVVGALTHAAASRVRR